MTLHDISISQALRALPPRLTPFLALILTFCLTLCLPFGSTLEAQIGGRYAFSSASLPTNARVAALGGSLINVLDDDIALAQINPAVTDSIMHNQLAVNHNFHFAGISHGNVAYGRYLHKLGLLTHAAVQYVNYGQFDQADAFGNINGEFSASEVGLVLGAGKQLNERIRAGVNFKLLTGSYESYNAFGLGLDIGLHYQSNENTSWALVLRNIGGELSGIADERRGLGTDLQIGFSKKLAHLPFRLSIIGHHLQEPYIRYDDPDTDITVLINDEELFKSSFSKNVDNLFRHLIFNGEFLLGKRQQFRLRFGYDHLRRQELKVSEFRSLGGFSFGFGINIKKIKIDYGVGHYHLAGAANHISFRYNIGRIGNKI